MGHYTGLKMVCGLKPEFVPVVEALHVARTADSPWAVVADQFPQYPFLAEWAKLDRSGFIPFGCDDVFPDEEQRATTLSGANWVFTCSLKNYGGEIEAFLIMLEQMVEVATWEQAFLGYGYELTRIPGHYVCPRT